MKIKIALFTLVATAAAIGLLLTRPVSAQPPAGKQSMMEFPIDMECVVTVEMESWRQVPSLPPEPPPGFDEDFTISGKMVYFGDSWVVVRGETYDKWISRDKIIAIQASR